MFLHFNRKIARRLKAAGAFMTIGAAACLALNSCADAFFEEFTVKSSFLQEGKAVVVFSSPVDASSAKNNFLFAQDDERIEGNFYFAGSSMIFEPITKISENHCYKITIYSGAMDKKGNELVYDYSNTFYTKSDLEKPSVVSAFIIADCLQIEFSKSVDQKSFLESFSIAPEKDFFVDWNNEKNKATISFKSALLENTLYSIKIASGLKDNFNNKMENDFLWSWTNEDGAAKPEFKLYGYKVGSEEKILLLNVHEEADFLKPIEIVFTKPVDSQSIAGAISFRPQISFEIEPRLEDTGNFCSSALIKFDQKPLWNKEYTLIVDEKIRDKSDALAAGQTLFLKNNSQALLPPKLEFIALLIKDECFVLDKADGFANLTFALTDYPDGQEKDLPIYYFYSISPDSEKIDEISAMEGTSVLTNACASITINALSSIKSGKIMDSIDLLRMQNAARKIEELESERKNLCLVKCNSIFINRQKNDDPARGIIEFCASEKICDDKKNFMEEKAVFACNKN